MSNQEKLFTWWWSLNGPREDGPLSVRKIASLLEKARHNDIVQGKRGKTISHAGWNYAVLKFLIKYCIITPEVEQKLVAFANPRTGNYSRWKDFEDFSAVVKLTATDVGKTLSSAPAQLSRTRTVPPKETPPDIKDEGSLPGLIAVLQGAVAAGGIDYEVLRKAVTCLSTLGYRYDYDLFPELEKTETYTDSIGEAPCNLAEALLWKLGKWKSYKKFVAYYKDIDLSPTHTDVVFYAFARHLKDRSNPIYDQHAIRALWAICGNFSDAEKSSCRSLLFNRYGKWKQVGSGSATIECYKIFVLHIKSLIVDQSGPSMTEIDRLLMPLGQAIKKTTNTYEEFQRLCGWPVNG